MNKLLQEDSGSSLANALALLFPRAQCLPKANCISLRKINKSTFHIISSSDNSNELSPRHYWELMTACLLTHQLFLGYHKFPGTVVNHTSTSKLKRKQLSKILGKKYNMLVPPGSLGIEMTSQTNALAVFRWLTGGRRQEPLPGAHHRTPPAVLHHFSKISLVESSTHHPWGTVPWDN